MNFYQWLQSIDPNKSWDYKHGIKRLEKQVCDNVQECGYLNLQEIYNQFFSNDDPGFPETKLDGSHFLNYGKFKK